MPVKPCKKDNKPGYKWGDEGKCYTYSPKSEESRKRARDQARKQGQAIKANQKGKED